ncbi:MAG: DedA family protein [Candidatus Eiseniibacteriota bacterium]
MFDLEQGIRTIGLFGVFAVVFAETGLLIGFFLPGDSLLFTAGFLASQGVFDIGWLSTGCFVAAVLGNIAAYSFGHRVGRRLFERPASRFFKREYLVKAHSFYEKYGASALIIARFMPVVRVFAPIVAGVGLMDYRKFMFFNILGGALWCFGLTWLGYWLGNTIPDVDRYLLPIIGLIILVSVLPAVVHWWQEHPESRERLIARVKRPFKGPATPD